MLSAHCWSVHGGFQPVPICFGDITLCLSLFLRFFGLFFIALILKNSVLFPDPDRLGPFSHTFSRPGTFKAFQNFKTFTDFRHSVGTLYVNDAHWPWTSHSQAGCWAWPAQSDQPTHSPSNPPPVARWHHAQPWWSGNAPPATAAMNMNGHFNGCCAN